MSIDSDDNFDDIDKLLDEIDTAGQKPKPKSSGSTGGGGKNEEEGNNENVAGTKLTLNSDGNGFKVNYGGGFKLSDLTTNRFGSPTKDPSKSVRFSENSSSSTGGPPKSNFISSLLQKDTTHGGGGGESQNIGSPPPSNKFMSSTPKNPLTSSQPKSDWLGIEGIGRGESSSPILSPKKRPGLSANNTSVNFDEDDVGELLQSVNEPGGGDRNYSARGGGSKTKDNSSVAPSTTTTTAKKDNPMKAKSGFDLDDDFWPKPTSKSPAPSPAPIVTKTEPESDFRSILLQKAAMARGGGEREDSPFEPPAVKFQPSPTTTTGQPQAKSIVDVLPFLNKKPQVEDQEENFPERSRSPYPTSIPNQQQPPPTVTTKTVRVKKSTPTTVATVASTVMDSHKTTLQLPSHLIDQEELKSMCNSLKSLYMTQLEMQEKSYLDQMDCLASSHARKEELLREEIKIMHKEYDSRLERLKNELLDNETKIPQRFQNELSAMASFTQQLQNQAAQFQQQQSRLQPYTPNSTNNNPSLQNMNASEFTSSSPRDDVSTGGNNNTTVITQNLDKIIDEKLTAFLQTVQSSLKTGANGEPKELVIKLDAIHKKFDSFSRLKLEEESKKNLQIMEAERNLQDEIVKLNKQQKKIKESVVKAAVTSMTQAIQFCNEENTHKKDKVASQLKDFRKDMRRILRTLDAKNEVVQKSHVSLELDQKQILKSLRDIQNVIQVNNTRANIVSELRMTHPDHFGSSTTTQSQQQNEMELRLLKEERNALADSIAQINVERRKLNEEKINFERDKMDFEREKNRLRDLEVNMRVKTTEAQDMKKQAEEMRRLESNKAVELTSRVSELERERIQFKEQHYASEQRLRIREQKLIQEKTELMREKEFLEKLRGQSLCPGCMSTINQFTMASRSDGDGIDFSTETTADFSSKYNNVVNNTSFLPGDSDAAYFQKESSYLDDLYYKHFNTK